LIGADDGFWYDASNSGTFGYSSGSVVNRWDDLSGRNNHLTQATVAKQPSRTGTLNGLTTVVFDGTNDALSAGDTLDLGANNIAMFGVVVMANDDTQHIVGKPVAGLDDGRYAVGRFTSQLSFLIDTGSPVQSTIINWTGVTAFAFTAVWNRDNIQIAKNGATAGSDYRSVVNADTTDWNISQDFWVGSYNEFDNYFLNGQVAELFGVIRSTDITPQDMVDAHTYLKNKWGTP